MTLKYSKFNFLFGFICVLSIIIIIYLNTQVNLPFYIEAILGFTLIFNILFISITILGKILKSNISAKAELISSDLIKQEESINEFVNIISNSN